MASDKAFADFIMDQLAGVEGVSSKKMFGEYAISAGAKVVALLCDNALYLKPTEAGRKFIGNPVEASPYQGAKPCFLIGEAVEEREWLQELVLLTEAALPVPRPKAKKSAGSA